MRLEERLTEHRNPRSVGLDRLTTLEMLDLFHVEDRAAVEAVVAERENIARVVEWIVEAFRRGGRLFYVGAGTSGRLGVLDAAECPPTFSVPPTMVVGIIAGGDKALRSAVEGAEDFSEEGVQAIQDHDVGACDVVVGIATSGRTPYVLGALQEAHRRGAKTVLLSCTPPEESLRVYVDGFITPLVGPEIIAGSTRLKAGTATKLVLNQLTTCSMVRIGKVYDNWMVDVRATNSKLRDRARRLVRDIAHVDDEVAQQALDAAGGSVKVALVMLAKSVSPEEAQLILAAYEGHLRPILDGDSQ